MATEPLAWKDRPSLIEYILPAQKISAEAQKERKANVGQTLTALGSYWKGRKPLILNKACILGTLLPSTSNPEEDLAIFEMLMAIDDDSFVRRLKYSKDSVKLGTLSYLEKLTISKRPEECDPDLLYQPIWERVNKHLGTDATNFPELVEQLGILRFGQCPRVGDAFCGSGQIPFEAARLGCHVYASDLNPIACMLTWGALNIVGGDDSIRRDVEKSQHEVAEVVEREIAALGIEHDSEGNRAKAYLYCLEVRCPQTGWMVPMAPTWVISKNRCIVAKLLPDRETKRFAIQIVSGASAAEIEEADKGTVQGGNLVYELDGETHRTPIKTLRGDYRLADRAVGNKLRRWEKHDFVPHADDIFQERLYAIHWIKRETLRQRRQETFFAGVTEDDLEREKKVEQIIRENLARWQEDGIVPDMLIEPGDKTDEPIRTRGWTYWHHLFTPRQLLIHALYRKRLSPLLALGFANALDWNSKLCHWHNGWDKFENGFYNQALNTFWNFGLRALSFDANARFPKYAQCDVSARTMTINTMSAANVAYNADVWITDPPYADSVNYHEITEFFIAWLRKSPPGLFKEWIWDSRRPLAIQGSGEDFRREMIAAYGAMADHMPDNGLQVVMFTHQDAGVWADMSSIVWGAGLKVTAAWYIATETSSELKKGGYVQGTVLLVLRKRLSDEATYRDELVEEVREEVARQIETMTGLNQRIKNRGCSENLFEDADLQMAGYAAALRVLTSYRLIDGQDMATEALRPRQKGERDTVKEIIDYAVTIANEHLVPEGIPSNVWERCSGAERFYLKMLDMEAVGLKKLDNYQNFAKAFRVTDYGSLMGSMKANDARLKSALDFKKGGFEGDFGKSPVRAVLFALYELQREVDSDEVMSHLRDLVPGYLTRRDDIMALCQSIAIKREKTFPDEAAAARILFTRIKNERLGG